jgi:lipoprotein-anchoring transpeptidase ErfK/SrfK
MINSLSRRDFLKLSASGALGLVLSEIGMDRALAAPPPASQGRITWSGVPLYDAPSFKAKELHLFGIDVVVELKSEVEGDEGYGNQFNKTWYQIDNGYAYSGWIQPVETKYQKPVYEVRVEGQLGEICVPMSETRLIPYITAKNGYRLYYSSTHWIKKVVVTREEKSIWYEIFDNELKKSFYVPHYNMRIIPDEELTPLSPNIPAADKLIHVDLPQQMVTAFEGNTMVFSARCSSGGKGTSTPTGEFSTFNKWSSFHMTNQDEEGATTPYHLPGVPWTSYFTSAFHGLHGTYWHNDYGRPRSHGCVNLKSEDAKWVYRWSNPTIPAGEDNLNLPGQGTRVQIV